MDPKWFDSVYYGKQKVIQMNDQDYAPEWLEGKGSQWTETLYSQYLSEYRLPGGKPVTAFENFQACNAQGYAPEIEFSAINVSCNSYFDVEYYGKQVADWANSTGIYGQARAAWTAESITAYIFNNMRMSLWEHFRDVGLKQQLNPSDSFDTHACLVARAAAMNKAAGVTTNTVQSAIAAIQANGENAIMDYYSYGQEPGIKPVAPGASKPTPPTSGGSSSSGPSTPAPLPTENVTLGSSEDGVYEGKDNTNTTFAGSVGGDGEDQLKPTDQITGGTGDRVENALDLTLNEDWVVLLAMARPKISPT